MFLNRLSYLNFDFSLKSKAVCRPEVGPHNNDDVMRFDNVLRNGITLCEVVTDDWKNMLPDQESNAGFTPDVKESLVDVVTGGALGSGLGAAGSSANSPITWPSGAAIGFLGGIAAGFIAESIDYSRAMTAYNMANPENWTGDHGTQSAGDAQTYAGEGTGVGGSCENGRQGYQFPSSPDGNDRSDGSDSSEPDLNINDYDTSTDGDKSTNAGGGTGAGGSCENGRGGYELP